MHKHLDFIKFVISIGIHALCLFGVIAVIWLGICRHIKGDTRALMTMKNAWDLPFIAFTVCPHYHDAYKDDRLEAYGLTKSSYKAGNFTGRNAGANPWQIFEDVTHEKEELLSVVSVKTKSHQDHLVYLMCIEDCGDIKLVGDGSGRSTKLDGGSWNSYRLEDVYQVWVKYQMNLGRCYEFRLGKKLAELELVSIHFTSKKDRSLYIYLHTPGQFQSIDEKSKVIAIAGAKHFVDMYYTVQEDSLEEASNIPCTSKMNHMLDDCIYKMAAQSMRNEVNCVLPYLPREHGQNLTICIPDVAKKAMRLYSGYFQSEKICEAPCMKMTTNWGIVDTDSTGTYQNRSFVKIYLKSTVQHITTVPDYSVTTMLGEFGGYIGVLLGYSVADLKTLMEWMYRWCQ